MKRIVTLCVIGVAVGIFYPTLSISAGVGLVIGWLGIEQPEQAKAAIDKLKEAIGA